MDSRFVKHCKILAIDSHRNVNHKYDKLPYDFHLQMVVDFAKKYIYLVEEKERDNVLGACWLHDTIEDCRLTYNDILQSTNERVAELVYALTTEKGKNRAERANKKYYDDINKTAYAVFIKLCDRLANVDYSKKTGSSMFEKYKQEHEHFCNSLNCSPYFDMIIELNEKFEK